MRLEPCQGTVRLHWTARAERSNVFYMFWHHFRAQLDSTELPTWNVLLLFYAAHWGHAMACQATECLYCILLALKACLSTDGFHRIAHTECVYCVLHTLVPCQGTV